MPDNRSNFQVVPNVGEVISYTTTFYDYGNCFPLVSVQQRQCI